MEMDGGHAGVLFRGGDHPHPPPPRDFRNIAPLTAEHRRRVEAMVESFNDMMDNEFIIEGIQNDDEFGDIMERYINLLQGNPTTAQLDEMDRFIDEVIIPYLQE
jgi:hypothetical protein